MCNPLTVSLSSAQMLSVKARAEIYDDVMENIKCPSPHIRYKYPSKTQQKKITTEASSFIKALYFLLI